MTYDSFLSAYNNRYWDFDGYYGAQCMDLIQFYARELGLARFSGNAADVANQYPAGWVHVSVPQRGDVVFYARNAANGYAGHIAIYDRPGYYFSQNYPTGTNSHIQYINEPIISILRPTSLTQGTALPYSDAQYQSLFKLADERNAFAVDGLFERIIGRKASAQEMRDYKTFTIGDIVSRLRNSGERKDRINEVYQVLLGRLATDDDLRIRSEQDLPEMWRDVANSQAHKDYINSLRK
jgi:hypothetical protein